MTHYNLLLTTHYLLLTTDSLLHTTHHILLIADCLLLTTHYSLPILLLPACFYPLPASCSLLVTHYALLASYYFLPLTPHPQPARRSCSYRALLTRLLRLPHEVELYEATILSELIHEFRVPRLVRKLRASTQPLLWPLRHWAKRWIVWRLSHAYQMGTAYVRAQQVLQHAAGVHGNTAEIGSGTGAGGVGNGQATADCSRTCARGTGSDALGAVVTSLHTPMALRVVSRLQKMQRDFPRITRVIQTRHAANVALRHQRAFLQRAKAEGELTEADAALLVSGVNRKLKAIYLEPMRPWGGGEDPALPSAREMAGGLVGFARCQQSGSRPHGSTPRARELCVEKSEQSPAAKAPVAHVMQLAEISVEGPAVESPFPFLPPQQDLPQGEQGAAAPAHASGSVAE